MTPLVAGGAVVALITAAAVVFAVSRSKETAAPAGQQAPEPIVTPTQEWAPPPTTTTDSIWTTTPSVTPSTTVTEADVRRQIAHDHDVAERLVGSWVPQLSSKSVGLVVHGVTYDYPAIIEDFRRLQGNYPDAVMVDSGDYNNFSRKGFFVTLKAETFASADLANAWCDQQGFAPEDCHAGRLTHTGGPAGNSKPR
ncbi:serine/threonine-protein kinase [Amycolatopsis lexingtonensis]|uniref:Serine/threonine-protein kinase n=1 Tax=Amycolatopsis lexingtonensis TaxID=218822 RepID=A0ABR9HZ86_9PSEU|nr:zinc ribbon domain-containing protein [Amycolatopsis lexingtonensis]MBE1496259.1 serine/threonine-protein kinase [Amycolatopsis lexingtonensis]